MARRKGIIKQVQDILDSKLKIGSSKHADKKLGITSDFIYSWNTYRTYLKHSCYFVKWAKSTHNCKTIVEARPFVDEYLQKCIDKKLSPYTQKLTASALAKLYGCRTDAFIKTETRHRANISRSRGQKIRDKHFSETKNKEFIEFCKATGLRRSELKTLKKDQLCFDEDSKSYYLKVTGKGGRTRQAPILTDKAVNIIRNATSSQIWAKIPNGADIHSYRADYCTAIYQKFARQPYNIPISERYCCRGDLKGVWYDKTAMLIASQALGHNRISVIAGHYIKGEILCQQ